MFWSLFTEKLAQRIVDQTNLYARTMVRNRPRKRDRPSLSGASRDSSQPAWRHGGELTITELQLFLGRILLMGIRSRPEIRDYWSTRESLSDPYISSKMSRDRFEEILARLHLAYNFLNRSDSDRLWKIRPMIDSLNESFQQAYHPTCEVSIDEGMVPFKGRIGFKQYMKNKPCK